MGEPEQVGLIPVGQVSPDPAGINPRHYFDEKAIEELSRSIRAHGQLEPARVRKRTDGEPGYWLVYGERRWRACKAAGEPLLAMIVEMTREEALDAALAENLDRQNLSAVEEAVQLYRIQTARDLTMRELAEHVGRSYGWVANRLRLLALPPGLQDRIAAGDISYHATRSIIMADTPSSEEERGRLWLLVEKGVERALAAGESSPLSHDVLDNIVGVAQATLRGEEFVRAEKQRPPDPEPEPDPPPAPERPPAPPIQLPPPEDPEDPWTTLTAGTPSVKKGRRIILADGSFDEDVPALGATLGHREDCWHIEQTEAGPEVWLNMRPYEVESYERHARSAARTEFERLAWEKFGHLFT